MTQHKPDSFNNRIMTAQPYHDLLSKRVYTTWLNKWVVLSWHECNTTHFNPINIKHVRLTQIQFI